MALEEQLQLGQWWYEGVRWWWEDLDMEMAEAAAIMGMENQGLQNGSKLAQCACMADKSGYMDGKPGSPITGAKGLLGTGGMT